MIKALTLISVAISFLALVSTCYSQSLPISFIEVFGNRHVSKLEIIQKSGIHEGDTVSRPGFNEQVIVSKIKTIPAVKQGNIQAICCEDSAGGLMLFIGIAENDSNYFSYHKTPVGAISLPGEITSTYFDFMDATKKAVISGNNYEDDSNGYSLMTDSTSHSLQKKFIDFANRDLELLQKIIHEASDAKQREIAACVIAYHSNKEKVVAHLLYAVSDPDEGVRNNATRALSILSKYAAEHPSLDIKIPAEPFIKMIHSIVWTDRNKGAAVLEGLSRSRNSRILLLLRNKAMTELIEMAKWRSKGHAYFSFAILGRIAGLQEVQINKLFENHIDNVGLIIKKIYSPKTFIHFAQGPDVISH